MKQKRHLIISICLLTCCCASLLQANTAEQVNKLSQFSQLNSVVLEEIAEGRGPGVALAIVKNDQIIYQRAFGKSRVGEERALKINDSFRSASTLKMMVGAALAKLHVTGKIDLHKPISRYIDGLSPGIGRITAHQLLTHTSGILDESVNDSNTQPDALEERMKKLSAKDTFLQPGTAFSYSNPGYSLAGFLIQTVSGQPFAEAMDSLIFKPAQMKHSTFSLERAKSSGMAYPHRGQGTAIYPMQPTVTGLAAEPSGTMFSTISDYARFLMAVINTGEIAGKQIFPQQVVQMLKQEQVTLDEMVTSYAYSYGLMVGDYFGHKALFHTGGMPGYSSNVLMLPDEKIGVVLFTNGENLDRRRVLRAAVSAITPIEEASASSLAVNLEQVVSGDDAQLIAGRYIQRHDLPTIRIAVENNHAILTNRGIDYTLYHDGKGDYIGVTEKGFKQRFRVGRDETGAPLYVQWWIRAFAKESAENTRF